MMARSVCTIKIKKFPNEVLFYKNVFYYIHVNINIIHKCYFL